MRTFRQFIEDGGDDLRVLGRELDVDQETLNKALQDVPVISFQSLDRKGSPRGSAPQIILPDRIHPDGRVTGRLMQGKMAKLRHKDGSPAKGPQFEPIDLRGYGKKGLSLSNIWLQPMKAQAGGPQAGTAPPVPPLPGGMG